MSHTIKAEFKLNEKNLKNFERSVLEAGGKYIGSGIHTMYSGSIKGEAFLLPGWRYPIVITNDGEIKYDNYGGNWGKNEVLEGVIQNTVQKSLLQAAKKAGFRKKSVTTDDEGRMIIRIQQY